MKPFIIFIVAISIMLSGCLVGPNYKRPAISAPTAFRGQATAEQSSFADQGWWDVYSDPFLNVLIKEALKNNYDLKSAIARAKEADAYRAVARSAYLPTVDENSGIQRDHGVYKEFPELSLPTNTPTSNLFLGVLSPHGKSICGAALGDQTRRPTRHISPRKKAAVN